MTATHSVAPGSRLGPYEVLSPLGAGGMGEVYRARDSRLGREVAVKILPGETAQNEDAQRRFEQEARAVAALSHPNILAIHDFGRANGRLFAVTELLEGETLRARLRRGPLSVPKAVETAAAIADGLAAAHRKGVVHRDLKPENVFLTKDGHVKILDFGLAKLRERIDPIDSASPTSPQTHAGVVLGTVGYMSPEQASGKASDARGDIFSFGCVLHEMVGGERPFARATAAETMAAILNADPPVLEQMPAEMRRLIGHCLEKDPEARFQSARDLAFDLRALLGAPASRPSTTSRPSTWRRGRRLPGLIVSASVVLALVLGTATGWFRRPSPHAPEASAVAPLTSGERHEFGPVLSPDGKFVAYKATHGGRTDLWVRFIGGGPPANISSGSPFGLARGTFLGGLDMTPDGTGVAAQAASQVGGPVVGGIWIFPVPFGGPPRKLLDRAGGVRWSPDGQRLVFVRPDTVQGDALFIARADGQDEKVLIPSGGGTRWVQPAWSSDAASVYVVRQTSGGPSEIWRVASGGGAPQVLIASATNPEPTPDGAGLFFHREGNIWWRALKGGAERRLTTGAGLYFDHRLSKDGRRLVATAATDNAFLTTLGTDGVPKDDPHEPLTASRSGDGDPAICARNGALVFTSTRSGSPNLWIADARGGQARPLTSSTYIDLRPAFSPDARQIAFLSDRGGKRGLWVVPFEGGAPHRLADAEGSWGFAGISWSSDGRRLLFGTNAGGRARLWTISSSGGTPALVPGVEEGRTPAWSPTDDVIAYSTQDGAVRFVRSTGEPVSPEPVRTIGGITALRWSHDGKRLAVVAGNAGLGIAELSLLDMETRRYRRVATFPAYCSVDGVAWSPDDRSLILGRRERESHILLFDDLH